MDNKFVNIQIIFDQISWRDMDKIQDFFYSIGMRIGGWRFCDNIKMEEIKHDNA